MLETNIPFSVKGHVTIKDDLGNILLDQDNAVHPQNMARAISRALAGEHNFGIFRIAFGNGGTTINGVGQIAYKTPNDGLGLDTALWASRLYNETYSEIVEPGNILIGTDPGSAGRSGGGSYPSGDPVSVPHVSGPGVFSNELGLTSEVLIVCVLNANEPLSQFLSDQTGPTQNPEADFVFDEIGLYTSGRPSAATAGYVNIDVGNRLSTDATGLSPNTLYTFSVTVDGGTVQNISFITPAGGSGPNSEILYGDLCDAINLGKATWGLSGFPAINGALMAITDYSGNFGTIAGAQTYGFLRIESVSYGAGSSIAVSGGTLIPALNDPTGATILSAIPGIPGGVQNDPVTYVNERERLLTHLVFSPVLKSRSRALSISYKLTISVARSI